MTDLADRANRLQSLGGDGPSIGTEKNDAGMSDRLLTRTASEIEPLDVDWLWTSWLAGGTLSILSGYGGSGKSTVALGLAAVVTTGGRYPDGTTASVGNVSILAAEDSADHVVVPRLIRLGANLNRITVIDGIKRDGEPGWLNVRADAARLEQHVQRSRSNLLIIDPISSYVADANGNAQHDVRPALMPLVGMAERTGVTILAIRHLSKGGEGRTGGRILGSVAWHDVPRTVLMLADAPPDHQKPDGTTRRVLEVIKSDFAAPPKPRMAVHEADGGLTWLAEPSPVGVEACLWGSGTSASVLQSATVWLIDLLKEGPMASTKVQEAAENEGISQSTLNRAKKNAGIKPKKDGNHWCWRLPPSEACHSSEGAQPIQGE